MIHEFRVYGEVRGQGRPRVDYKRKRLYKDKRDVQAERRIKDAYINSGGGHFGDKPLMLIVISHRHLPDSKPKRIKRESDTLKPDGTNICKSVEDALNGIAWHDDSQIVCPICLKAQRKRDDIDHMDIIISDEIDEDLMEAKVRGLL